MIVSARLGPPQRRLAGPELEDSSARKVTVLQEPDRRIGVPGKAIALAIDGPCRQRTPEVARADSERKRRQAGCREASQASEQERRESTSCDTGYAV